MKKTELADNPVAQFNEWYSKAKQSDEKDPAAMFLATASKSGHPSIRTVLYKGTKDGNFLVYTNYGSRKAHQIRENPYAALAMYWPCCYRQIRVEGKMEMISSEESVEYFNARPRDSQIAAWASEQSQEISGRDYLIERFEEFTNEFKQQDVVPCPEFWGGYRLIPDEVEFWQGQQHRLHDRFCYRRKGDGWEVVRLAP